MNFDDLIYYAENKMLKILADCGLKYLHSDIAPRTTSDYTKAIHTTVYMNNTIQFKVFYDERKTVREVRN